MPMPKRFKSLMACCCCCACSCKLRCRATAIPTGIFDCGCCCVALPLWSISEINATVLLLMTRTRSQYYKAAAITVYSGDHMATVVVFQRCWHDFQYYCRNIYMLSLLELFSSFCRLDVFIRAALAADNVNIWLCRYLWYLTRFTFYLLATNGKYIRWKRVTNGGNYI